MNAKSGQVVVIIGAAVAALIFVKLMYDMSTSMTEMTGHVGTLSRDVTAMNASIDQMALNVANMNQSIQQIEGSMRGMGQAITRGSDQFQQWNPADMMKQVIPDGSRPSR
ncbi:MAG: hypothetical protein IZT60_06710 [Gammaproteobacteria bacterium]|nr:hypothetical protein [Gammaproteobacteria bacterium]